MAVEPVVNYMERVVEGQSKHRKEGQVVRSH